jgi:hypothetical protein
MDETVMIQKVDAEAPEEEHDTLDDLDVDRVTGGMGINRIIVTDGSIPSH